MIEASLQAVDQARSISEQESDASYGKSGVLQIFYDHQNEMKPVGFGWMHE